MKEASNNDPEDITRLINAWKGGNPQASEALFDKIYPVLRTIASRQLAKQGSDLTLETTDLIHETFLKMLDQKKSDWSGSAHFFAVASQVVRYVIVDHARHRNRKKRGGNFVKVSLTSSGIGSIDSNDDWLALDQAITELSAMHPKAAKVVELRYFGGMTNEEIASVISLSTATVVRHWRFARAWLKQVLSSKDAESKL